MLSRPIHTNIPADTTTMIAVSVCSRCGTMGKSGQRSCCGRGGSWFKNCGGGGSINLQHTWYEGIQACKARSQFNNVIGHELRGAQQKGADSSHGPGDKTAIAATHTFTFTLSVNTSALMPNTTPIFTSTYTPDNVLITTSKIKLINTSSKIEMINSTHTSVSTSINSKGCVHLLDVFVHINLVFIIILLL